MLAVQAANIDRGLRFRSHCLSLGCQQLGQRKMLTMGYFETFPKGGEYHTVAKNGRSQSKVQLHVMQKQIVPTN